LPSSALRSASASSGDAPVMIASSVLASEAVSPTVACAMMSRRATFLLLDRRTGCLGDVISLPWRSGVRAGATSPADALRGCATRVDVDVEAALARGARPAGLAAVTAALSTVPAESSAPAAGGGVLLSIYLSPKGDLL
jgi:hypothetical protein